MNFTCCSTVAWWPLMLKTRLLHSPDENKQSPDHPQELNAAGMMQTSACSYQVQGPCACSAPRRSRHTWVPAHLPNTWCCWCYPRDGSWGGDDPWGSDGAIDNLSQSCHFSPWGQVLTYGIHNFLISICGISFSRHIYSVFLFNVISIFCGIDTRYNKKQQWRENYIIYIYLSWETNASTYSREPPNTSTVDHQSHFHSILCQKKSRDNLEGTGVLAPFAAWRGKHLICCYWKGGKHLVHRKYPSLWERPTDQPK